MTVGVEIRPQEGSSVMRTKRLAVVATAVVALIVGFAAPAGASRPLEIASGTWTTVISLFDIDLTPGSQGPKPCGDDKPDTLAFTTTATSWTLTGGFSRQRQMPAGSGNWYQYDFTVLFGTGTWAGVAPTQTLAGNVIINIRITLITANGSPINCAKTNQVCTMNSNQILRNTPPLSTYKAVSGPGLPTTLIGDRVTLLTTGTIVVGSCSPPFNAVGGSTASFDDLQAVVAA
jgi:hypothetical protein